MEKNKISSGMEFQKEIPTTENCARVLRSERKRFSCNLETCSGMITWRLDSYTTHFQPTDIAPAGTVLTVVYKDPDIFIVVAWMLDKTHRIFEITRDYKVRWTSKEGFDNIRGISYCSLSETVLAYVCHKGLWKIIEVDKKGKIVNSLTGTTLGRFEQPKYLLSEKKLHVFHDKGWIYPYWNIEYDRRAPTTFWVPDPSHHCVYQTNWKGEILWQFGEYGVPGDDDTHLNSPCRVMPRGVFWDNSPYISDTLNHRVLEVKAETKKIIFQIPFPFPTIAHLPGCYLALCSGTSLPFPGQLGTFFLPQDLLPYPYTLLPHATNFIDGHPTKKFRILAAIDEGIVEYDLSNLSSPWIIPANQHLWSEEPVKKGKPVNSIPLVDWYRPNKSIMLKATQPGIMEIQAASFTEVEGHWDGGWETVDSLTLKENKATSYQLNAPLNIFRIRVSLNSHGLISGWINLCR